MDGLKEKPPNPKRLRAKAENGHRGFSRNLTDSSGRWGSVICADTISACYSDSRVHEKALVCHLKGAKRKDCLKTPGHVMLTEARNL